MAVVAVALIALHTVKAQAHPHVWIDNVVTFLFADGRLVGLRHEWRFDPFFSSMVIGEFDKNGDGKFDTGENAVLAEVTLSAMKESKYFTRILLDDAWFEPQSAQEFRAEIRDDNLIYRFTQMLPQPVDPTETSVMAGVYDESYYVEVLWDEIDPVRFEGGGSTGCNFTVREAVEMPYYYDLIFPVFVHLHCRTPQS